MYRCELQPVPHTIPHELDLWWLELEPATSHRARRDGWREALIQALSSRLGRAVQHSEFVTGPTGKPRLESSEIGFNLSHSGREVLDAERGLSQLHRSGSISATRDVGGGARARTGASRGRLRKLAGCDRGLLRGPAFRFTGSRGRAGQDRA